MTIAPRIRASLAISALVASAAVGQTTAPDPSTRPVAPPVSGVRVEAEQGVTVGAVVAADGPDAAGFSGGGYVTNFDEKDATLTLTFPAAAGAYDVRIGYRSPQGFKGYDLTVNGLTIGGHFEGTGEAFAVERVGRVELAGGTNTVVFGRGWGFFDIDYLEFEPAGPIAPPPAVAATPVDPDATPEARALLARLASVYGRGTLSGVHSFDDADLVERVTGERPAIVVADLMDYSPSRLARGSDPGDTIDRHLAAARDGAALGLTWHWNAPSGLVDQLEFVDDNGNTVNAAWYKGFYTYATTFDVEAAMDDPSSPEYAQLVADLDAIAVPLRRYADAGVPVLWRPLHEANGRWFWWSAKGPGPYVKLWRLVYDRLVNHHGLHNLIWVYNGDWASYPGDDYCDIVGVDAYRDEDIRDPLTGEWQDLQDPLVGKKMLALTEFGKVPDVPRMQRLGVWWSYFVSWSGGNGPAGMAEDELRRIYADPGVINLDDWRRVAAPPDGGR